MADLLAQMAADAGISPTASAQNLANPAVSQSQNSRQASPYQDQDSIAEQKYGLPPGTLTALSTIESNNNPKAVNKNTNGTIDRGRFQVNSSNPGIDGNDPEQVAKFVSDLYQKSGGDIVKTAAMYHGGPRTDINSPENQRYTNNFQNAYAQANAPLGGPTPPTAPLNTGAQNAPPLSGLAAQMSSDAGLTGSTNLQNQMAQSAKSPQAANAQVGSTPSTKDLAYTAANALASDLNPMRMAKGVGEFAAQAASGTAASAVGGLKGLYDLATGKGVDAAANSIRDIQQKYTYQPSTQQGQSLSQAAGGAVDLARQGTGAVGGAIGEVLGGQQGRNIGQSIGEVAPDVAMTLGMGASALKGAGSVPSIAGRGPTLEDLANLSRPKEAPPAPTTSVVVKPRYKMNSDGSYTEIANPNAPSPIAQQIQQTKSTLATTRPDLDSTSLQRHAEADSIGVQLTSGQASGNPVQISNEMNARGNNPAMAAALNAQNTALVNALDNVRAKAAPDISAQGPDISQALIDSYKTRDAQVKAEISANYQKLQDANGGQFPLNGDTFVNSATQALKDKNVQRFLPSSVQGILDDLKGSGNMTFNDFENYRTILGQQERAANRVGDGTASYAIQTVRNALENIPMNDQAASVKALADIARRSSAARFKAIESDPAYKAIVNDDAGIGQASPLADKFIQTYVINGRTANVAKMYNTIGEDPTAVQALKAGVIDHLKASSGIDLRTNTGNLSQSGLNKAIQNLGNKSNLILGDDAEVLNTIGNVARYTQQQPKGSFVNNSNTLPAMMASGAKNVAEGIVNVKTGGMFTPIKNMITSSKRNKALTNAANPIKPEDLNR
jgi:hypothetical protein